MSLLLLAWLSTGCGQREASAPAPESPAAAKGGEQTARHLAYEHSVVVDVPAGAIATTFEAVQSACAQAAAEGCEVLTSRLSTGRQPGASLRFRAAPAVIPKLLSALAGHGEIVERSTTAEDLSLPIADAAKKLAMLNDYRAELEALRHRAINDVDSLMKVSRELAQVQSESESLAGEQARLGLRVRTEILAVSIGSRHDRGFWRPIGEAADNFGGNLSQGIAGALTGVAYLLPWLVLLGALAWIARRLWRWRRGSGGEKADRARR